MPVSLDPRHSINHGNARAQSPSFARPLEFRTGSAPCLAIGLVNNMPDGALEATERQFLALLNEASDGISIRLSFYSLPGVPRNEWGARHIRSFYSSADSLRNTRLDGLIVTGREPLAANLSDEPYWESFAGLLEWARSSTHSTVWSCLAAHAAVLHMDGIRRIKGNDKHCGVFEYARSSNHPLTTGTPLHFKLPHSRWNSLPEDELTASGYSVLTRSAEFGVDTFIQQQKSLFVFFQGHPEYESDTLQLEYRRDVGRYLRVETDRYPSMPQNYFDFKTASALSALQQQALSQPREELLANVSTILGETKIENTWRSTAACMYRNWLEYICAQKQLKLNDSNIAAESHLVDSSALHLTTAI